MPDVAARILTTNTAAQSRKEARDIPHIHSRDERKEEVMETIIRAKIEQVPSFRDALAGMKYDILVEAVAGDYFWGSGLSAQHTATHQKEQVAW